ncbi:MAG: hypothetical protein IKP58_02240 [Victivallales bacterium]|nr:hypothetical protein [Victivallales bacterium]
MCKALDDLWQDGKKEGRIEGREEGRIEGRKEERKKHVCKGKKAFGILYEHIEI